MNKLKEIMLLLGVCLLLNIAAKAQAETDTVKSKNDFTIACNCQSVPAGLTTAVPMLKGIWMFSYRFMDMRMDGNLEGSNKVSDDEVYSDYIMVPREMNMQMHMIMGMYGITPRLTAMAMVNYTNAKMHMDALPGDNHQHGGVLVTDAKQTRFVCSSAGFGDSRLYIIYGLLRRTNHHLNGSLGVNVPTGNIYYKGGTGDMYEGQRVPYMMRLGSGTVDFLPGLTYLYTKEKLVLGAQVSGLLHPWYNSLVYKMGDEFNSNIWASYRFANWVSGSVRVNTSVVGDVKGFDEQLPYWMEPAAAPQNFGGTKLVANSGLNFTIPSGALKNTTFSLEFGLPVYQNVNGIQAGNKCVANAGIDYMF